MFLSDAFKRYYSKYDRLVDYFLTDYLVDIAYENIPRVSVDVDSIAKNNPDVYFLQTNFDQKFDPVEFEKITLETKFFKLNWREQCSTHSDGEESYSSKVFKLYIWI